MVDNKKLTFYVKTVPLHDVFHYGYNFREQFFMKFEYDALSEMPFMFDPYRELLIFPDTVPVDVQKKAVKILLRVINRPSLINKGQDSDFDKLDALFSGDKRTYSVVHWVFIHYYEKRNNYFKGKGGIWSDTAFFAYMEKNYADRFKSRDYTQIQLAGDFLAGNTVCYKFIT